ncbi:hypothetical protein L2E82_30596 [Cichorium intybus]|uniref:Uncharacterized protein n=1 Tax=Cichorium intybus TaxID=13427 RepID=A0ACB9D0U3_CICIN|nr:hypothetical protein L2E82_30596 [Cichorium intybus]
MDATTELDMIEAIRLRSFIVTKENNLSIVANTKNLRWIDWQGDFASHLLSNFPQMTLRCLMLSGSLQEQLWEGCKLLPNLKKISLHSLQNLIRTPDFNGLPNIERFILSGSLLDAPGKCY